MYRTRLAERFNESSDPLLMDVSSGLRLTYNQGAGVINAYLEHLHQSGIGQGDRLAVIMENSPELFMIYLSALMGRIVVCPINPALNREEVEEYLDLCKADAVIARSEELSEGTKRLDPKNFSLQHLAVKNGKHRLSTLNLRQDDLFSITFTSGTTGRPKAIAHYAETHLANAKDFNTHCGLGPDQRVHHVMPMFYMAGILNTILCPVQAGGSVVTGRAFGPLSPFTFWDSFLTHGCNTCWLSPTMVVALNSLDRNHKRAENVKKLAAGLSLFSGTAPLSMDAKKTFFEKYGVELMQSYGLSETLIGSVKLKGGTERESVGSLLEGTSVEFGHDDEIILHTNYLMAGYLDQNGKPVRDEDRAFYTGDLGKSNRNELFITGRKKELIIKGGENINPIEIESMLMMHDRVTSAAVVGYEDHFYGEDIAAFITVKSGFEDEAEADVLGFCRQRLKHSLIPSRVVVLPKMPLTPTGKIQKAKLKASL